jgi:hypothetical protein
MWFIWRTVEDCAFRSTTQNAYYLGSNMYLHSKKCWWSVLIADRMPSFLGGHFEFISVKSHFCSKLTGYTQGRLAGVDQSEWTCGGDRTTQVDNNPGWFGELLPVNRVASRLRFRPGFHVSAVISEYDFCYRGDAVLIISPFSHFEALAWELCAVTSVIGKSRRSWWSPPTNVRVALRPWGLHGE